MIRRIDALNATITTLAVTGAPSMKPYDLVRIGNALYVSDRLNCVVWRVDLTTRAGSVYAGTLGQCGIGGDTGPATSAKLQNPGGIGADSAGNLYIADTGSHVVRRVDATTRIISVVAGQTGGAGFLGDGGAAVNARLNQPEDIAFDNVGRMYIADAANRRIRAVFGGNISSAAGTGEPGLTRDGRANRRSH